MKKFAIISLGCSRNLVDSEVMAGILQSHGLKTGSPDHGVDVCVVNTCAFVESAREESIDAIISAGNLKKEGKIKYLVVSGCLSQMYDKRLVKNLPEADLIIGTSDFPKIFEMISSIDKSSRRSFVSGSLKYIYNEDSPRSLFTPGHYAYVKISEGCDNRCSYCVIPKLRGSFRSRSVESIINEVKNIAHSGHVKEIELIGQDVTMFGMDRQGKFELSKLLRDVCALNNSIEWVRLLYTHPAHYTDELIYTIASESKICKYLDLPVQHIKDKILKLMGRRVTRRDIEALIKKLRKCIPDLTLRTSIIVGFPGESEKDFKELMKFIKDIRFDRLGAFTYSRERGTKAYTMTGHIPEEIKKERLDAVMTLQRSISDELLKKKRGKAIEVIIDEAPEARGDNFIGRSRADAPEVDGLVYVSGDDLKIGSIYNAEVIDTMEYDISAKKVKG